MGRYVKGILGGFSGKVGNIVGGRWKGINYMRSLSEPTQNEPTERQLIHRARFAFASQFLQPLNPLLKVGFRTQSTKQSAQNAAMSDFMTNALDDNYPRFNISFDKLRIAKGSLVVAQESQVNLNNGQIVFSWNDNEQILNTFGNNQVLLAALSERGYPTYSFNDYSRSDLIGSLPLPTGPSGTIVYCYLAFAGDSKNMEVSNSKLVGTIVLP